ncbi:beta strand repeat-containing protein [Prochlorococcus marinus]|uniref:beta strand repeat-containing protein n=1 Tax=Prochlorococcus TaxID=1218 RepID=UPI0007B377D3|nr:calcium-binding protein [Prochlorococcus marinus]KZR78331.1 Hemolysin, plasmid [Prochlorococcus marinus str. MIT 1323]
MAFTTVQGSGANDATSIVGTSGVDSTIIQNLDSNIFVGAQEANDAVNFTNYKALVSDYTVKGGAGNDTVGNTNTTSFNTSYFNGNAGNDTIAITNGTSSTVYGGAGNDTLNVATLNGGVLNGNKGDDTFTATANIGAAQVYGGAGGDQLRALGGLSNAGLKGSLGNDNLSVTGAVGASVINGNGGNDTVNAGGVITSWATSTAFGGAGNDTLNFSAATTATVGLYISGDDGNDAIDGGSGDDTILTGIGTDTVRARAGNDSITANTGVDTLQWSEAGSTNVDTVTGYSATADRTALTAAGFTVSAGLNAFSLSDGNGADVGVVAAGALDILASAANGTENLTNGGAGGAVVDILFLSTAASTFAAAKGTGDLTVANFASNEAITTTWYDTDTSEMVIQATWADAGNDDINSGSAFAEVARIAMAQASYTAANVDAMLSTI